MENIDGDDARDEANSPGEADEPPIVLDSETGQHAKHGPPGR
jgi:hypothetical protein